MRYISNADETPWTRRVKSETPLNNYRQQGAR